MGRSPEMTMYILMKAKHKYALEQHEILLDELALANAELSRVRAEKDVMMDRVLHATFGYVVYLCCNWLSFSSSSHSPEAEYITRPIQDPTSNISEQRTIPIFAGGPELRR